MIVSGGLPRAVTVKWAMATGAGVLPVAVDGLGLGVVPAAVAGGGEGERPAGGGGSGRP